MTTALDERLSETVLRLLEALASPLDARVLGPSIVREICYRVLMGEQGPVMRGTHQPGTVRQDRQGAAPHPHRHAFRNDSKIAVMII